MITKASVYVLNLAGDGHELLRTIPVNGAITPDNIEDYAHSIARKWLNEHHPNNWRYVGQYQLLNGQAGDLVPASVDTEDAERDACYAAELQEYERISAVKRAEQQRDMENDPLYPAAQAAWTLYAPTKGRDPQAKLNVVYERGFIDCDDVFLGWTLKEAHDFLVAQTAPVSS